MILIWCSSQDSRVRKQVICLDALSSTRRAGITRLSSTANAITACLNNRTLPSEAITASISSLECSLVGSSGGQKASIYPSRRELQPHGNPRRDLLWTPCHSAKPLGERNTSGCDSWWRAAECGGERHKDEELVDMCGLRSKRGFQWILIHEETLSYIYKAYFSNEYNMNYMRTVSIAILRPDQAHSKHAKQISWLAAWLEARKWRF